MAGACLPGCEPLRGRNCAHARRYTKRYMRVYLRSVVCGRFFGTCSASVPHPLAARGLAVAPNRLLPRRTMCCDNGLRQRHKGCSSIELMFRFGFDVLSRSQTQKRPTINCFQAFFGFRLRFLPCFGKDEEEALLSLNPQKNPASPALLGGEAAASSSRN